ncbi:MAG: hypothetical protein HS113_23330 [Verrucomicrobiales bacterium]|nr:hypothetical protein [Verrucomicrobiales bacterium]
MRPPVVPLLSLAALLACSGCARLNYVKVPPPTQYDQWSDAQQKKADAMKGVRYYLPRPFLSLKQSTPVAQRTALISFRRDADGYTLETPADTPTWVRKVAPKRISITQALALTLAQPPGTNAAPSRAGGQEGGTAALAGAATNALTALAGTAGATGGPDTVKTERPPSELHARTGFLNTSDPVTRLGDRFDVVYLPDFEEQYVIQPKAGLGTADIETQLRNGWAAEVFSQRVDNSNLIPYVINQFEHASEAAANIFTTWAPAAVGLPPGLGLPQVAKALKTGEEAGQIGEAATAAAKAMLGEVLLFKLAEVRIAQPGLYPVLKPREIDRLSRRLVRAAGTDPEDSLDLAVRMSNLPWIRQDMAFIPCPPFTVIGFNTTSDVFLAPATDRPTLEVATNRGGTGGMTTEQAMKNLETAFRSSQAGSRWGDKLGTVIDPGKTQVTATGEGDVELKLEAQAGTVFPEGYAARVKEGLLSFFQEPAPFTNARVKVSPPAASGPAQIQVVVPGPATELALKLRP